ncbi:MAG: hypothetical protein ACM31C_18420 [Acidobacteriota bacterium]
MAAQIPDLDEVLASSARSEHRQYVRLGALLVGGGVAMLAGVYALTGGALYAVPTTSIVLGVVFLNRGLGRPR